jgi:hypothetical protein
MDVKFSTFARKKIVKFGDGAFTIYAEMPASDQCKCNFNNSTFNINF